MNHFKKILFILLLFSSLATSSTLDRFEESDHCESPCESTTESDLIKKQAPEKSEAQEANLALTTLESEPSSLVAGCVSAISGAFIDSHVDLVVPGPQPLTVQRSYCSLEKAWHFQHLPRLEIDSSQGGNHILAAYVDDSGSGMSYRASTEDKEPIFTLPSTIFDHGLTNCGSGEISGQTNWKNAKLFFTRERNQKLYVLRLGSHVERSFSRYKRYGEHHRTGPSLGKSTL